MTTPTWSFSQFGKNTTLHIPEGAWLVTPVVTDLDTGQRITVPSQVFAAPGSFSIKHPQGARVEFQISPANRSSHPEMVLAVATAPEQPKPVLKLKKRLRIKDLEERMAKLEKKLLS